MAPRSEELNQQMRQQATEAILQAAMEVFTENGFHGATMAAVAKRAGVSKGLTYHYFRSKDDLLRAIVEEKLLVAMGELRQVPEIASPYEKLRAVIDGTLRQAVEQRDAVRLYLSLLLQPGMTPAVEAAAETLKPQLAVFYRTVGEIMDELGHDDPVAGAVLFHAALNGLVMNLVIQPQLLDRPDVFPLESMKAQLLDAFAGTGGARLPALTVPPTISR